MHRCLAVLLLLVGCPAGPADDDPVVTADDDAGDDDDATLDPRPNILLVIADDFGIDAASFDAADPCYQPGTSSDDAPMPRLGALCRESLRFRAAWAMPVCSPTRATILTGTGPWQHGVGAALSGANALSLDAWTLPQALDAWAPGYQHANVGKWHLSPGNDDPNTMGWQHYAGLVRGTTQSYFTWPRVVDGLESISNDYTTTAFVDDAVSFIEGTGEAPWFVWLAFNAPHTPFHVPPADLHTQDLVPYDDQVHDDARPWFRAMAQAMDTEIGRLFDAVQARGEWDDTWVIFIGDNGTARSVNGAPFGPQAAKGSLREGGITVPMLVKGPGVEGDRASGALTSVADFFPTILELAGADPVAAAAAQGVELDGVSLLPVLRGEADSVQSEVFAQVFGGTTAPDVAGSAIRNDLAKLICHEDGSIQLYDLQTDRWESDDLYVDGVGPEAGWEPTYQALRDALRVRVGQPSLCD